MFSVAKIEIIRGVNLIGWFEYRLTNWYIKTSLVIIFIVW